MDRTKPGHGDTQTSSPGLARGSTSSFVVDGRAKPGHDEQRTIASWEASQGLLSGRMFTVCSRRWQTFLYTEITSCGAALYVEDKLLERG